MDGGERRARVSRAPRPWALALSPAFHRELGALRYTDPEVAKALRTQEEVNPPSPRLAALAALIERALFG